MADKIKKFFQKKKVEAKFKMAGPGHKLSESTSQESSDRHMKPSPPKRSGLSEASKTAAEAALARLQQKRENPTFNTSLAAIQVIMTQYNFILYFGLSRTTWHFYVVLKKKRAENSVYPFVTRALNQS